MSAHVKTYHFILYRQQDRAGAHHTLRLEATGRTLEEAESEFRHWLRKEHPEILDDARNWGYQCEVRHV